jgi:soluble cytochrome b562
MKRRLSHSILPAVLALGLVSGLAISTGCQRQRVVDHERARVLDTVGVLSDSQRQSITDYLEFVEFRRGVDYRVVVIDEAQTDLLQEGVSRYAHMQIGARSGGKGILLLVNVGAEEARVEVGYELEHRMRDVEASSMIGEFLAPYFSSGQAASGIEASVERLVDVLEPGWREIASAKPLVGSGGAGATGALLEGIDGLTSDTKAQLKKIMIPQARPEDCVNLEIALMHKGIYYREVSMYDEAWRRASRPDFPAHRLQSIAREWDGPFNVERVGDHAITHFSGVKGRRWGPQFLQLTDNGWIIDASSVAKFIVYDYSNRSWYAVDDDYPYLALIKSVYDMKLISLRQRGRAWRIDSSSRGGR